MPNWADRTRPLWRIGNRIEALQLRWLGTSGMTLIGRNTVLLLETTGRRTGRRRRTPVAYWRGDDRTLFVGGGAGGQARVPDWVANLRADGPAAVWIGRRRFPVAARELTGDERNAAQDEAEKRWPSVRRYERRSGRRVPYFELRIADPGGRVGRSP